MKWKRTERVVNPADPTQVIIWDGKFGQHLRVHIVVSWGVELRATWRGRKLWWMYDTWIAKKLFNWLEDDWQAKHTYDDDYMDYHPRYWV